MVFSEFHAEYPESVVFILPGYGKDRLCFTEEIKQGCEYL